FLFFLSAVEWERRGIKEASPCLSYLLQGMFPLPQFLISIESNIHSPRRMTHMNQSVSHATDAAPQVSKRTKLKSKIKGERCHSYSSFSSLSLYLAFQFRSLTHLRCSVSCM